MSLIGSRYFKNYIITLDYQNKRVGFLPNKISDQKPKTTFGFNFTPLYDKLFVNTVLLGSDAEKQGIHVGDEIVSVNGALISDLPVVSFCRMYRGEFRLIPVGDESVAIEILRDGEIFRFELFRYDIF